MRQMDDYEEFLTNYIDDSKNLALLLDYDGTLTPIVSHPSLAKIPAETKECLQHLSESPGVYIAVVSGRDVNNVKEMVGIDKITYAGNHGLEILYANGTKYNHKLPDEFGDQTKKLITELEAIAKHGAWIENKGATLTFHYREAPEHLKEEIRQKARDIMERNGFKITTAHMALEARPKVEWNKGTASLLILETEFGEQWVNNLKVIFAGDDTTDEDAMLALKGKGATFRITNDPNIQSHADRLLSSTESVVGILKHVERIIKKRCECKN